MASPSLVDGDLLELKTYCQADEQLGLTVSHWLVDDHGDDANTHQVAVDALWNNLQPYFASGMPASATALTAGLRRVLPLPRSLETLSTVAQQAGLAAGTRLPRQVSGIVTLTSILAGRANRGRKYIPFPSTSMSTATGHPTAPYMGILNNLGSYFSSPHTFAGPTANFTVRPVIWHRLVGGTTEIAGYIARQRWATQRRRGDYGKANTPPGP